MGAAYAQKEMAVCYQVKRLVMCCHFVVLVRLHELGKAYSHALKNIMLNNYTQKFTQ